MVHHSGSIQSFKQQKGQWEFSPCGHHIPIRSAFPCSYVGASFPPVCWRAKGLCKVKTPFYRCFTGIGDESDIRSPTELWREQDLSCQDLFVCLLTILQCIAVNSFSREGPHSTLGFEDWKFGWYLPQCTLLVPLKVHKSKMHYFCWAREVVGYKWFCGKFQKLAGPRWKNSVISLENFIFRPHVWFWVSGFYSYWVFLPGTSQHII